MQIKENSGTQLRLHINSRKKKNNRIVLKGEQSDNEGATWTFRNNFFSNIVGTDKTTERVRDLTHFPHDSASGQITLNYTSPNEVKKIMRNMKNNKSSERSAEVLCEPYCNLYNYILDVAKIPKQWKKGEITSVYK